MAQAYFVQPDNLRFPSAVIPDCVDSRDAARRYLGETLGDAATLRCGPLPYTFEVYTRILGERRLCGLIVEPSSTVP